MNLDVPIRIKFAQVYRLNVNKRVTKLFENGTLTMIASQNTGILLIPLPNKPHAMHAEAMKNKKAEAMTL